VEWLYILRGVFEYHLLFLIGYETIPAKLEPASKSYTDGFLATTNQGEPKGIFQGGLVRENLFRVVDNSVDNNI
jgi:hypothetical protein